MQLSELQTADIPLIKQMRTEKVLRRIRKDQLPKEGDEIVACSDGERIVDLLMHHRRLCEEGRVCHHSILLNSGPLLIPIDSPTAAFNEGTVILEHALAGQQLKKVKTIHLYGHWPCGAANATKLSLVDCLTLLARAKERTLSFLEERGMPGKVIPLFHVHYVHEDQRLRSYYFDRHRFANVMQVEEGKRWRSSRKPAAA